MLHPESTSSALDPDPSYGAIKEPIIKVLQYMKAMEYKQTPHDRMFYPKLSGMVAKVGQMAHESPDQFGFFLTDYTEPGQLAQSGLTGGPAQILTFSTTVSMTEGFFALSRNGLSGQDNGFGSNNWGTSVLSPGDSSESNGYLDYAATGSTNTQITQDVANMLTAGRLSNDAVTQVATALDSETTLDLKTRLAQQLISTSPEFHTTNIVERTADDRVPSPRQERSSDGYKAVVVIMLSGGWDAFNVLTPHTTCTNLYPSYRANRGGLALGDDEMLPIINDDPNQPCTTFGIHNSIPIFKEIYDDGYGQFHANIGHLAKPVTKRNWYTETRTHLFSHTTMEREAQLVDAFQEDGWSTGVGGRMLDILQSYNQSVNAIGIDEKGPIIEGNPFTGRKVEVIPSASINLLTRRSFSQPYNTDLSAIEPVMEYLNKDSTLSSGVFADYWSQNLVDTLNKTVELNDWINNQPLVHTFSGYSVSKKLKMVAKMMMLNEERQVNKDFFYLKKVRLLF